MFCFGVSGREILLVVAVFCFAWQRRMSLGQGGVESDGGEVPMGEREERKEKRDFFFIFELPDRWSGDWPKASPRPSTAFQQAGSDRPHGQGRYGSCPGSLMVGHSEN